MAGGKISNSRVYLWEQTRSIEFIFFQFYAQQFHVASWLLLLLLAVLIRDGNFWNWFSIKNGAGGSEYFRVSLDAQTMKSSARGPESACGGGKV